MGPDVQDYGFEQLGIDSFYLSANTQAIKLLAQDVRLEQPSVGRKELRELTPLRPPHGLPATQLQPALAATEGPHDGPRAKEFLAPHVIERSGRVLQDVECVEHHLRLW